jgi:hypothetical protein
MTIRFSHQFTAAIERCISDADEAAWFAEHPERKYFLRPSCAAEIAHRCTFIPETARPLAPGCSWATLVIRLKRGGFNRLLTPYCCDITGEEDDEALQDVFRQILGPALRRQNWRV